MKKISYILLTFLTVSSVLSSCSSLDPDKPLSCYELQLTAVVNNQDDPETRAKLYNSTSDITSKTLTVYGWEDDTKWLDGESVTYNKTSKEWSLSGKLDNKKSYTFLSYANMPSKGATITAPSTKSEDMMLTVSSITSAQNDILLGGCSLSNPASGDVTINYSHPLASVSFILGNAYEVTSVTSITISGVYASGETTFNSSTSSFTWTNLGSANATISSTGLKKTEADTIATFVVIPQDLSTKNVVVTVTYDDGKSMTKKLTEGSWTAGNTTYYCLDKLGTIDVTANGKTLTNSGDSKVYVRATITGAWYDGSGNVVGAWTPSQGTFNYGTTHWVKDGNTFYYSEALAKNAVTEDLFASYSKPTAPVTGATLKLEVLFQAIPYHVTKSCQDAFAALL